jgi:hypothetical protein
MFLIESEDLLGAAMEKGWSEAEVDNLIDSLGLGEWHREANRSYPDQYVYGLGRHVAHPAAVRRLREEVSVIPRVVPEDYDILFNAEGADMHRPGPTWDLVKWVPMLEPHGYLPGMGWVTGVVYEPLPFYHISAVIRSLDSLGDRDFEVIRRNATTLRGGSKGLWDDSRRRNEHEMEGRRRQRADEELAIAHDVRPLVARMADEAGV